MASVIESLAFDGLLVAISDELSEPSFTELLGQYDVQVPENTTDKFRKLQYIKNHGNLNLEKLVEKLSTLGCKDLSDKAGEISKSTKRDRKGSTATVIPGQEPRETQPDQISPGSRKKGTFRSKPITTNFTTITNYFIGQSDGNDSEDDEELVEEIQCVKRGSESKNDIKYLEMAKQTAKKSKDPNTTVEHMTL